MAGAGAAGGAGARAKLKQMNRLRPRDGARLGACVLFRSPRGRCLNSRSGIHESRLEKNLRCSLFPDEEAEVPRSRECLKYGFTGDTIKYPVSPDACSSVERPSPGKPKGLWFGLVVTQARIAGEVPG